MTRKGRPRPLRGVLNETRSFVGWLPGERVGGRCAVRSRLEHDGLALLEFDPPVVHIERNDLSERERLGLKLQDLPPNYVVSTSLGRYTPDLRVTLLDRTMFVSIGTVNAKTQPPEPSRLRAVRAAMAGDGYDFVMLTEREIRGTQRASNVLRLIGPLVRASGSLEVRAALASAFAPGRLTIREVIALVAQRSPEQATWEIANAAWSVIARAAHSGDLDFDLDGQVLDLDAVVRIVRTEEALSA